MQTFLVFMHGILVAKIFAKCKNVYDLNLISLSRAQQIDFVEQSPQGSKYKKLADKIDESLRFIKAIGVDTRSPAFTQTNFYTAHECLLLPYEQALTRQDSITNRWYDCSSHMLWVGERTRQLDHAHVHYCTGIGNPIGIKSMIFQTTVVLDFVPSFKYDVIYSLGQSNAGRAHFHHQQSMVLDTTDPKISFCFM